MSISCFILYVLGALVEIIFLYTAVNGEPPFKGHSWLDRVFTPSRSVIALLSVAALFLVGIFELSGIGKSLVYIDTPLVSFILGLLAVGLLGVAMLAGLFLPIVNEQSILLTQVLVLASAWWGGDPVDWLPPGAVTVFPAILILLLALIPRGIPSSLKAILYFWYLLSLLAIPFQSGEVRIIQQDSLSWAEGFSLGMLSVFLLLHGLLAVRFFLITSSLLRPRNRALAAENMPRLFSDEQVPVLRFAGVFLIIAALLAANHYTHLLVRPMALSLCSLLGVQLLSRPLDPSD
jgi:hypothetical protein